MSQENVEIVRGMSKRESAATGGGGSRGPRSLCGVGRESWIGLLDVTVAYGGDEELSAKRSGFTTFGAFEGDYDLWWRSGLPTSAPWCTLYSRC